MYQNENQNSEQLLNGTHSDTPTHKKRRGQRFKRALVTFLVITMMIAGLGLFVDLTTRERVNVLIMGIEGTRTDVLIFASIDPKNNAVDLISIPRDTYVPTEGKNGLGQKKINAVYGFKNIGGARGVTSAVSRLLSVPIHYYVSIDYDGVSEIVDLIGGVEVDVPYAMRYDDPYAKPPLHIDFQPGPHRIWGNEAMPYLRFRKSNDGSVSIGDVGRIERQQDFVKQALKGMFQIKLPYIVYRGLHHVDTDIPITEAVRISAAMLGTNGDSIQFHVLPAHRTGKGKDGLSYFFHDPEKTQALLKDIFSEN